MLTITVPVEPEYFTLLAEGADAIYNLCAASYRNANPNSVRVVPLTYDMSLLLIEYSKSFLKPFSIRVNALTRPQLLVPVVRQLGDAVITTSALSFA